MKVDQSFTCKNSGIFRGNLLHNGIFHLFARLFKSSRNRRGLLRPLFSFVEEKTPAKKVFDKRKPMLLFELSGISLLRLAARTFFGLLFHAPPRTIRLFHSARSQPSPPFSRGILEGMYIFFNYPGR